MMRPCTHMDDIMQVKTDSHGTERAEQARPSGDRLIRCAGCLDLVQVSRAKWLAMVKDKQAPAPIKLGGATLWSEMQIREFIADKLRAASGGR